MVTCRNIELQPRDHETLEPLIRCYRVTTPREEAIRHGYSVTTARKRLDKFVAANLLNRLSAWIAEIPDIRPLVEWRPGDPDPDFFAVAYAAQVRWKDRPVRRKTIYCASNSLLSRYALPPRKAINKLHATHDLAIQHCYRWCKKHFPELEFIGEELFSPLRGFAEGVEDFQMISGDKIVYCGEYLGKYRASRCRHLHEHIAERGLPYLGF